MLSGEQDSRLKEVNVRYREGLENLIRGSISVTGGFLASLLVFSSIKKMAFSETGIFRIFVIDKFKKIIREGLNRKIFKTFKFFTYWYVNVFSICLASNSQIL